MNGHVTCPARPQVRDVVLPGGGVRSLTASENYEASDPLTPTCILPGCAKPVGVQGQPCEEASRSAEDSCRWATVRR